MHHPTKGRHLLWTNLNCRHEHQDHGRQHAFIFEVPVFSACSLLVSGRLAHLVNLMVCQSESQLHRQWDKAMEPR